MKKQTKKVAGKLLDAKSVMEEISIILREEIIATFVEGETDLIIQFINGQKFHLQIYEMAQANFS